MLGVAAFVTADGSDESMPSLVPNYSLRGVVADAGYIDFLNDLEYSPVTNRLFIAYSSSVYLDRGQTLALIDTNRVKYLSTWEGPDITALALSRDGRSLYAYSPIAKNINIFDADTLTLTRAFPLRCLPSFDECQVFDMFAGPDGRIYWYGLPHGRINVVDTADGTLLTSLVLPDYHEISTMAVQGNRLFVAERLDLSPESYFYRFDISQPVPVEELKVPLEWIIHNLAIAADGSFLLTNQPTNLLQIDPETLTEIRMILAPRNVYFSSPIIALNSTSFTATTTTMNENFDLNTYQASSGNHFRTGLIDLNQIDGGASSIRLIALKNDEIAAISKNRVFVYHPSDYALATAVIFANHCGTGPVVDNFSDPASGWPRADNGSIVYRYDRDQYSILHREDDNWTAVTRGDYWNNGREFEVRTWIPAKEGISGIIFSLNDDWTRFKTLEIIPGLRRWVVFSYENEKWQILATNTALVNPIGQSNKLRLDYDSSYRRLHLYLNGVYIFPVPNDNGRIGLTAGSFEPEVDSRFDDYFFVGQNCPIYPRRSTELEFAPPIDRPPLETFLP
ncbi:MAG: hypothetical protein R6X18_14880 [Chloroflexota bacterium]|jgi:hypothetical protein